MQAFKRRLCSSVYNRLTAPFRCDSPRMQHYVKTNGGLKPGEALKSYFGAVPDHFK